MPSTSAIAYVAGLRSAVECVAKTKHLTRVRVEHRVNARGELVVALLVAGDCEPGLHEDVRAGLEELAIKNGDGARVATKKSARAGHVIALIVPPKIAGQWTSLDPSWRPVPLQGHALSHLCLTCRAIVTTPDYAALLALGWQPESPHLGLERSGWRCGRCASKTRPAPKRYRR